MLIINSYVDYVGVRYPVKITLGRVKGKISLKLPKIVCSVVIPNERDGLQKAIYMLEDLMINRIKAFIRRARLIEKTIKSSDRTNAQRRLLAIYYGRKYYLSVAPCSKGHLPRRWSDNGQCCYCYKRNLKSDKETKTKKNLNYRKN